MNPEPHSRTQISGKSLSSGPLEIPIKSLESTSDFFPNAKEYRYE